MKRSPTACRKSRGQGIGQPEARNFPSADDLADACVFLMGRFNSADVGECINIGSGEEGQHPRAGGTVCGGGGLSRRVCLRYDPAGRHAAQIAGRLAHAGAQLASENRTARMHRLGLSGFLGTARSGIGSGPLNRHWSGSTNTRDGSETIDMFYNGKEVVVTGADGFIGSHLVERLVQEGRGSPLTSLYNSFDSYSWLSTISRRRFGPTFAWFAAISGNSTFVLRLLEKQEMIFHLARAHRHSSSPTPHRSPTWIQTSPER